MENIDTDKNFPKSHEHNGYLPKNIKILNETLRNSKTFNNACIILVFAEN